MLTFAQAITIARRSIKTVSGTNVGDIDQNDIFDMVGVPDDTGLRLVKRLACESMEFGAPKYMHSLDITSLATITTGSTVGDFADRIKEKAH